MSEQAKHAWHEFKHSEPGKRFQARYERRQRSEQGRFKTGKVLNILGGLVIIVVGLLIGLIPGPGGFIAFLGLD